MFARVVVVLACEHQTLTPGQQTLLAAWRPGKKIVAVSPNHMHYLYGSKSGVPRMLVATFGSEQQLLAYVRWATLAESNGFYKFEQGSTLASFTGWSFADHPLTAD